MYPHPHDPGKFLYVGQERKEGKRDKDHRSGRTSFEECQGRNFRESPERSLEHQTRKTVYVWSARTNAESGIKSFSLRIIRTERNSGKVNACCYNPVVPKFRRTSMSSEKSVSRARSQSAQGGFSYTPD